MRDTHTQRSRDIGRGRNRLPSEPDVGLDPRTLGSRPEPKAYAQPLSHPGIPGARILIIFPPPALWHKKRKRQLYWT